MNRLPAIYYWRLQYPDGTSSEDLTGKDSIRIARPGAEFLHIHKANGELKCSTVLTENQKPVFYRVFSSEVKPGREQGVPVSNLDAVVFGRGWETDNGYACTLWAILPDGSIVDCPESYNSPTAIRLMILGK